VEKMKFPSTVIGVSAMSDKGLLRKQNEDALCVCMDLSKQEWRLIEKPITVSEMGSMLIVADGMGGARAGDVASKIAVETVANYFKTFNFPEILTDIALQRLMSNAIFKAHDNIIGYGEQEPSCLGMGTTIVMAWVLREKVIIGWVGDSRCYLIKNNEIKILTHDHSYVWQFVESGSLTPDQADMHPQSNIINQCLGDICQIPLPDYIVRPIHAGDIYLLCSDGLNAMLRMNEIKEIVLQKKSLKEINKDLIDAANSMGGHDNVTNILLEIFSS
jgi:PPM family protein phosphatase